MVKEGRSVTLSIPDHKEVKRALLAALLRTAEISEERYLKKFK